MDPTPDRRQWVLAALDQFEARLLRYAQRLLGNLDDARDVVQFVFLKLCDEACSPRLRRGDPSRSDGLQDDRLAQWLYTVCRNRALDVLRANGRESVGWAPPTTESADRGQSPPYQLRSREDDPADSAEQADLHALLRTLVERLPANQREAIDLWADGFSYAEISRILSRHEGHVRVLVHRGLKTLREHPQVRALLKDETEIVPPPKTLTRSVSEGLNDADKPAACPKRK